METLRILLSYPDIMYQCIERMDRAGNKHINESVLAITVKQQIKSLEMADQQRLLNAFDSNNLHHANVVSNIDKRDDGRYLLFQESIITLFRLCEASLHQEITNAKLRSRMVSLQDVRNRLMSASFIEQDSDYSELNEDITEQLGSLLGMLRNSILAMQRIGETLEEMTADASKSPDEFSQYRQTMFEKTIHLFDRHIKPTLVFLNPDSHFSGGGTNLFKTINEIQTSYTINHKHVMAGHVFSYLMSLSNLFKPVQKVERQIDHFLRKTRTGMLQYNAMESAYRTLKGLYEKTQTSSLKHLYMDTKRFNQFPDFVLGLKQHNKRPQTYQFGDSLSYYENVFSEITLRLSQLDIKQPSLSHGHYYKDNQSQKWLERSEHLYQWLDKQTFRPTKDLVASLHYRLDGWLEGYCFTDLLIAMIRLNHKTDWNYQLITTNNFFYITIESNAFVYRQRQLIEKKLS